MIDTKLLTLLQTLLRSEFLEFGRYLHNGFFTRDPHVRLLYDYLRSQSKDWQSKKLEKSYIIKGISSEDKVYTEKRLAHISSDLYLHLEDYLAWKRIKKDETLKKQLVLEALQDYNLNKSYFLLSEKIEIELDKTKHKDTDYYYQKMRLYHQRYAYPNQLRFNVEQDYLFNAMNNLEIYYISSSVQYYIELYTRKNVLQIEFPFFVSLENLLERLKQPPFDKMPLFQIKRWMLQLLLKKDDSTYQQLKLLVIKHIEELLPKEQYLIINALLNYTIESSRTGQLYYLNERFDLYQLTIQYQLLIENGYLNPLHFLNIVDTALVTNHTDWASNFINDYPHFLHTDFRINTILLAKAHLAFSQSNFGKTILLLNNVDFESLSFLVISKSRLLQSYFELVKNGDNSYELPLESLIKSYKNQLLRRLHEHTSLCQANINFIDFLALLYKQLGFLKSSSSELHQVLESLDPIAYKVWLVQKIQEISNN